MKNEHVLEFIDDYVDGELSGETLGMVEAHLASCPSCRKEAEDLKSLTADLGKLPLEIEPPGEIVRDLPGLPDNSASIGRIFTFRKNGTAGREGSAAGRRDMLRFRSPAFIVRAAAVFALVVCGGLAWYLLRPASPGAGTADIARNVAREPEGGADRVESAPRPELRESEPADAGTGSVGPPKTSPDTPPGTAVKTPGEDRPAAGDRAALKTESRKGRKAGESLAAVGESAASDTVGEEHIPPAPGDTRAAGVSAPARSFAAESSAGSSNVRTANTGTIAGTVRDKATGEELFGVNVLLAGTTRGAATDPDGRFRIVHVPPGSYALRATAIGYGAWEAQGLTVAADSTSTVEISLTTEPQDLAGVSVAADQVMTNAQASGARAAGSKGAAESVPNVKGVDDVLKLQSGVVTQGNNLYLRGGRSGDVRYDVSGQAPGTESYEPIDEGGFRDAAEQPKSTFSIDVDAASYSNVRRFLDDGQLPPADAVRIEEMINYFTYAYPLPQRGRPLSVTAEMAECPWSRQNLLLMVGIRGREIDPDDVPPANLVFLIDVSGSMQPADKLPLLKEAFRILVDRLRPQDRVSIVVYAGQAGLVLPSTRGDRKRTILRAIDGLAAGGSTAGGAGLRLAYSQARDAFIEGGNNRVILATDGDFNVGVSSDEEMVRLIEKERNDGIFLSVLGVGTGNLKDSKMEKIADRGNGNYYYIDGMSEARKVFGRQLSGTLYAVAKDVKIRMEFNPDAVSSYRLIGYENRVMRNRDFRDDRKDAGELGSGHTVTALYEIVPAERGREDDDEVAMNGRSGRGRRDRADDDGGEIATVSVRYKEPDGSAGREFSQGVRDERPRIGDASENLRFAAAVAEFGMMLRNSEYRGTATYRQVLRLAQGALGRDPGGYRAGFVRMVEESEELLGRD